jgi:hypothetical protein
MFAIERPMSRSLYAEAWLIVWSSCWLAVVFLGMIVVFVFGWPWLIVLALPIFVLSHAAAIAFAFHFRCPACQSDCSCRVFGPYIQRANDCSSASHRGLPSLSTLLAFASLRACIAVRNAT